MVVNFLKINESRNLKITTVFYAKFQVEKIFFIIFFCAQCQEKIQKVLISIIIEFELKFALRTADATVVRTTH